MPHQDTALVDAAAVAELAASLSRAADALHARALQIVGSAPDDAAADPSAGGKKQAQGLYEAEVALRLRAQSLEDRAALCAVSALTYTQQELLDLVDAAERRIRQGERIKDIVTLGADLLTLSGAAVAGVPADIVAALKALQGDALKVKKSAR